MSPFLFADAIVRRKTLKVFNFVNHRRYFACIDDITEGVLGTPEHVEEPNPEWSGLKPDPGSGRAPWRVNNIGNR
jgi:UDP-glucuronate 4-epimerase